MRASPGLCRNLCRNLARKMGDSTKVPTKVPTKVSVGWAVGTGANRGLTFAGQDVTIIADDLSAPRRPAETRPQAEAQTMELGRQRHSSQAAEAPDGVVCAAPGAAFLLPRFGRRIGIQHDHQLRPDGFLQLPGLRRVRPHRGPEPQHVRGGVLWGGGATPSPGVGEGQTAAPVLHPVRGFAAHA